MVLMKENPLPRHSPKVWRSFLCDAVGSETVPYEKNDLPLCTRGGGGRAVEN
jgi:hypothetical protein